MQMINLKKIILEAIQAIDNTTILFYQQKNQEGYQSLDQTLNVLIQTTSQIINYKSEDNQIQIDEQELNTVLGNAMTAMEQGDMILLSDILIFDLKSMFNQCLQSQ
ncbi:MAG: hypothetical protein ACYDEX_10615 [Mobilitalea sp.]